MAPPEPPNTYSEPTVMWRMRRKDGRRAHAVIGPAAHGAWVMWFVDGRPVGVREFTEWTNALRWSDLMRAQNWAIGWRLVHDTDDAPPRRREA